MKPQHMLHTANLISRFIFISLLVFTSGCSLFDRQPDPKANLKQAASRQRVFFANYDLVWRAAHAVVKYPLSIDNQDTGVLETEYIKGIDGWVPPETVASPSSGIRYKITLLFAKGKTDGREATRVTIDKHVEILRDFFSEPETIESDGLEEKIIFYRIERELIISEALKKVK